MASAVRIAAARSAVESEESWRDITAECMRSLIRPERRAGQAPAPGMGSPGVGVLVAIEGLAGLVGPAGLAGRGEGVWLAGACGSWVGAAAGGAHGNPLDAGGSGALGRGVFGRFGPLGRLGVGPACEPMQITVQPGWAVCDCGGVCAIHGYIGG